MQKTRKPRHRRPRKLFYFKDRRGIVATVYGLAAFADANCADLRTLRRVARSAEDATIPFVRSCQGWEASCCEEAREAREGGFHQYWVYGVPQDTAPTEEQLNNPPEIQRRIKLPVDAPRMFQLVDPDGTLLVCLGMRAFCREYGVAVSNLSQVLATPKYERHSFSLRSTKDRTRFVNSFTPYVCPEEKTRKYKQRWKKVLEPKPKWRKATVFDIRARVKEGRFRTVLFGHEFEGWPPPDAMQEFKLTRQDIIPDWLLGNAAEHTHPG